MGLEPLRWLQGEGRSRAELGEVQREGAPSGKSRPHNLVVPYDLAVPMQWPQAALHTPTATDGSRSGQLSSTGSPLAPCL